MKKLWWDWRERAIIALLLAACLVLAFLQYRWAGELSRAEAQRLFASAAGRLEQLTRAFDTELGRSVMDFIPSGEEVERLGPVRANEERFRTASQRLDRPVFRKIAAAVPDKERKLQFLEANVAEQRFLPGSGPGPRNGRNCGIACRAWLTGSRRAGRSSALPQPSWKSPFLVRTRNWSG